LEDIAVNYFSRFCKRIQKIESVSSSSFRFFVYSL